MVEVESTPLDPRIQDEIIEFFMDKRMRRIFNQRAKRGDVVVNINGVGIQLSQEEVTRFCQGAALMEGYNRGLRKR